MISQTSKVVFEFLKRDLSKLIDKYNGLDQQMVQKLEYLVSNVQETELRNYVMQDINNSMELVQQLNGREVSADILKMYFFMEENVQKESITKIESILSDIDQEGYVILDNILIYKTLEGLREYVETKTYSMVRDTDELERLFQPEILADYIVNQTSLEQIEYELLDNVDEYEDILEIDSEIMFKTQNGEVYYWAEI